MGVAIMLFVPTLLFALGASQQQQPPLAKTPTDVLKAGGSGFITLGGIGFGVTAVSEAISRSGTAGKARTREHKRDSEHASSTTLPSAALRLHLHAAVSCLAYIVTCILTAPPVLVSRSLPTGMPYFVMRAAVQQGQRLGRVSGGLSGGRALGQLLSGADGTYASMVAACTAGIVSATSLKAIPSSVVTFACLTYFIDSFSARSRRAPDGEGATPPKPTLSPGQRLDKLLGTTPPVAVP